MKNVIIGNEPHEVKDWKAAVKLAGEQGGGSINSFGGLDEEVSGLTWRDVHAMKKSSDVSMRTIAAKAKQRTV